MKEVKMKEYSEHNKVLNIYNSSPSPIVWVLPGQYRVVEVLKCSA